MKPTLHFALFAIACALPQTQILAQQSEMKWGKVSKEELAMTQYPQDMEAEAVVLGDYGVVEYDIRSEDRPIKFERHVRIKFLTQAGVDAFGDVEITYYSYERTEVLTGLKAQVYLPDGQETSVGKDNLFSLEENDYWTTETISFPGLTIGAVVEYKYTINSNLLFSPVDWYFQREIPIVRSDLVVKIPDWFDFVVLQQGRPVDIHQTEQTKDAINLTQVSRQGDWNVQQQVSQGSLDVTYNKTQYAAVRVPALKPERHITTMEDYYSHIRYQLNSVRFPESPIRNIMDSWSKVEERLLDDVGFGREYNAKRNGELVLEFAGITTVGGMNQMELARKLYDEISLNIRWNDRYQVRIRESIPEIVKRKEGSSADLNLTLLAGLLALQIEAYPVLTSTRNHGKLFELYPFMDQFNHTMVLAILDTKPVFLDVVGGFQPIGLPRLNALNYKGWMVAPGSSQWIDVIPEMSKSTYYFQLKCSADGALEGTLQGKFTGYLGYDERNSYHSNPEEYFKNHLTITSHTLAVNDMQIQNPDDRHQPWSFTCKINCAPNIESTDYIYLSPMFPGETTENPFKAETRLFPVEFNYSYSNKFIIDIAIPEGYVIESLPKSRKLESEDGGIVFIYRTGENQGRIQLLFDVSVTNVRYAFDQYEMLKLIFNEITSAAGEQVVLRKVT
ncbi:MAG TPA: DUF3857 domain-containing protein [Saprospiraceae bacterium]|nr:DUF3857 domain-containing protein [Saprospiraceae bacterium]